MGQGPMNFAPPVPCDLTYEEIEERATALAEELDFTPLEESVSRLADRLGGVIEVLSGPGLLHALESGSLFVRGPEDFTIYLSPYTGVLRDNFTIGHELGHYFLHSGNPPGSVRIKVGRFGDTIEERQANRFAAALLMPADEVERMVNEVGRNPALLAGWFNVSRQAVEARLQSLGL